MGMLNALGFQFLNAQGEEVEHTGSGLLEVASIDTTGQLPELKKCRFHILTDVTNPFCGPEGAACIFAPQKGATPEQVQLLDQGLQRIATLFAPIYGRPIHNIAGTGAGGGIAGGCLSLLNAAIEPGIEVIKQQLHFEQQIEEADLILTGEGKVDSQTLQGKVVSGVLQSAQKRQIPVIILTGNGSDAPLEQLHTMGMTALFSIHSAPMSLEKALNSNYTRTQLSSVSAQIGRILKINATIEKKFVQNNIMSK